MSEVKQALREHGQSTAAELAMLSDLPRHRIDKGLRGLIRLKEVRVVGYQMGPTGGKANIYEVVT